MRGLLFFFFWLQSQLFAYTYNTFLLDMEEELYPKILTFWKDLPQRVGDDRIDFLVIYDEVDANVAENICRKLTQKVKRLRGFAFAPQAASSKDFFHIDLSSVDVVWVLKLDEEMARKIAQKTLQYSILTFVYDVKDLRYGFLIGVDLRKEVQIYINRSTLLRSRFSFVETFYQIARFME